MALSDDQLQALLIQNGILTPETAVEHLEAAKKASVSLSEILLEKNLITEENLGQMIASYLKVPFVTLAKTPIPREVFLIIPERIARKRKVIAFAQDPSGVKVAMTDPANNDLISLISKKTGQTIIPHLALERDISNIYQLYRPDLQKAFDELIKREAYGKPENLAFEEAPITKVVDLLIQHAYQNKTSDIHIEPQENNSLIRLRIDGILHDVLVVPKPFHDRIITRIKVLSKLRTDEHLSAQDGKMRITLEEEKLDIRVSIIPIVDGEKVVLRLLSSKSRRLSLLDLGMNEDDLKKVQHAFSKSFGMILSTGPTGSGKSTSIYSILKIVNTREKNITTIEDPVEYRIKGVNQIQVNTKTNLTFAAGLRSVLRQDPNIIFVGEIRDKETASIAVNAALTGHLVLSTLHTNDASTTLPRLIDMQIEPFLVASTVNVIIAQRLVRKICDNCRVSMSITEDELLKNLPATTIKKHYLAVGDKKEIRIYKGQGCKVCHHTGYSGRVGVFEVLEVTKPIKKLIVEKADSDIINRQAVSEGMTTMLDDGLDKVAKGVTTIEEVLRVTRVETM